MAFEAIRAYGRAWPGPATHQDVARRQATGWRALKACLADCPALKAYAGAELSDIPIIDVAEFRQRFDDFNTQGLSQASLMQGARPDGIELGFSTGTTGGPPGLFVTTPRERATYTGRLLGKLLPPWQLLGLTRIALCLRAPSRLYEGGHVRFFALEDKDRARAIATFDPHVLIAPPQVLLELAGRGHRLPALKHLYYGAETLNDVERAFIAERLGLRPDPIYQATEGFLGAPCRLGTLHLNEDGMIFEREDLGQGRFRPVVTDLLRETQVVVRLRLNDLLHPTTCPCGSPLQAVHPVEGRVGDIWRWGDQTVFPGDVEAEVAPRLAGDRRWIATGHDGGIRFACPHDEDARAIAEALGTFGQPVTREPYDPALDFPKRRHVRWAA